MVVVSKPCCLLQQYGSCGFPSECLQVFKMLVGGIDVFFHIKQPFSSFYDPAFSPGYYG